MTSNTIDNDRTMSGSAGTLLANRYLIVRQLGQGGMGSVWLAEDTQLDGKQFAIKMLPSILVSNKRAYAQLKSEALVAMKLSHPNIVTLRAFEENNGNPFLVMDYIDGQTLDDYLAEKGNGEWGTGNGESGTGGASPLGGLPEDEVIRILKPIAAALDYAHKEGVVHRDVKPANVMIRKDGRPFILDFGISREMQETMTRVTGKLSSGTLLYMSPEQLRGLPPKPTQDVYSFAAMAYECLSGHPPFYRGAIEDQIKDEQPEQLVERGACHAEAFGEGRNPNAPQSIAGSIMAGLAKNPEDRPETCAGVLSGGVLTQRSRGVAGAEEVSRVPHDRTRVTPLPSPQNSHALAKSLGILAIIMGVFGLGALLMVNRTGFKSEKRSEMQYKGVRHVPSKPIVIEETDPVDGESRLFNLPGGVQMEMVYVAPGSFRMGSESGEDDEKPVHDVRLAKGYWIGKYPITQAQWNALVAANGVSFEGGKPAPYFSSLGGGRDIVAGLDTSDFPMESISWEDCDSLLKALNEKESGRRTWFMPTEAQWEFAARGGNKSLGYIYSGGNRMSDVGWYYENSGTLWLPAGEWKLENILSNKCRMHAVNEKDVGNELGIVGMSGNVWEWCNDWHGEDYYARSMTDDPQGPASGSSRVLRGGGWRNVARYCRSVHRRKLLPDRRNDDCGFRLCCYIEETKRGAKQKDTSHVPVATQHNSAGLSHPMPSANVAIIVDGKPLNGEEVKIDGRTYKTPVRWRFDGRGVDPEDLSQTQNTVKRMKDIKLPFVSFRPPATLGDAVEYFRQASKDFDHLEVPAEERGINFVLRLGSTLIGGGQAGGADDADAFSSSATSDDEAASASGPMPQIPAITAHNITLWPAFDQVCQMIGYKFQISGPFVVVMPEEVELDGSEVDQEAFSQAQHIVRRMKAIKIPSFSFRPPATIVDAIEYFRQVSKDFDLSDVPLGERGINIVLRLKSDLTNGGQAANAAAGNAFANSASSDCKAAPAVSLAPKIPAIVASNISLWQALDQVCQVTGYKFQVNGPFVVVMPKGAMIDDYASRAYNGLNYVLSQSSGCGGLEVTFERNGKRYFGTLEKFKVDWRGPREFKVLMREYTGPKHGDKKTLILPGGVPMEMIFVGPGSFVMGSPTSEDGHGDCEMQCRVTLTKGYWLGKYEVTQAQWRSVMGTNPSNWKGDNLPVESVSWDDCMGFVRKINAQLNCMARLPTEAEWEYACRAGTTGAYGGNGRLDDMGWYDDNSGSKTHEVGRKSSNAWGFHDMHGNVLEWCSDWSGSYSGNATDPTGSASGDLRVLRGGFWDFHARSCRSAQRFFDDPGDRSSEIGFRLCCSAEPRE